MSSVALEARLPQTLEEIDHDLVQASRVRQRVEAIDSKLEADIARLREKAEDKKKPLLEEYDLLVGGARTSAAAHKDAFIHEYGKTIKLDRSGWVISWRWISKVVMSGKAAAVIAALEREGHYDYIIVKKTPNRRALGMRPDIVNKIRGLKIERTERLKIYRPEE